MAVISKIIMEVIPTNYWNTVSNTGNLGINEEKRFDKQQM